MIKGHLTANKMLEKYIKDHPIVVGSYTQWLVSNSGRKEDMDVNIMATKLNKKLDKLSSSSASSSKIIKGLNIYVASTKKAADTAIRKLGPIAKK